MNLTTVMTELGTAASTIAGLRVLPWAAKTASPPALLFGLPDAINPNETYGRGSMSISDLPAVLLIGAATSRTALAALAPYCAGSGTKSLITAWQDYAGYTQVQAITVRRIEPDFLSLAGVEYLGATFHLDIVGSGIT
jgi:hypothetical protein